MDGPKVIWGLIICSIRIFETITQLCTLIGTRTSNRMSISSNSKSEGSGEGDQTHWDRFN